MFKKTALLVCSLLVIGCGGKKKDAPASGPAPVDMKEPKVDAPKVEQPKVEAPKVAEEPLMVEAVAVALDGAVEVKPADSDEFVALATNQDLAVGDHLRVIGEKGMLKLRMWDDTMITLAAGAEVMINPGAGLATFSPSITLLSGTTDLMVEPRAENQEPFLVYTPAAILSVLGTEFEVGVADSGAVKVGVDEGLVQVSAQDGGDLVEVPQGKSVVVALEGETSKPSSVAAFNADKEDWEKFYENEHKAAAAKVDVLTQGTVARLDAMKKHMEKLEKGIAELDAKSDEMQEKAEKAAAKNDQKAYEVEAAPLAENIDESLTAGRENQRAIAMMKANTYLLRRIDALIAAGVIKPTPEQTKVIAESKAQVEPWINDFDENLGTQLRTRHKRDRSLNEKFLRHHPEGRVVAEKTKAEQPEFYGKLPKADKPRVKAEPKLIGPVKFQPKAFKGKAKAEFVAHPKNGDWKAIPYKPADPKRLERAKKVDERALRARPKTAALIKMIPPKFRHRRPAGAGPDATAMGPEMGPEDMGPATDDMGMAPEDMGPATDDMGMGPEGMGPEGMGPEGMGPEGMGPEGMGPEGMGPEGMGPEGMGPAGMAPVDKGPAVMAPVDMGNGPRGM